MTNIPGAKQLQPEQAPKIEKASHTNTFDFDDPLLQVAVERLSARLRHENFETKAGYERAVVQMGRLKSTKPVDIKREQTRIEGLRNQWKKSCQKLRKHLEKLDELHKFRHNEVVESFNSTLQDHINKQWIEKTWDYVKKEEKALAKKPIERALTIRV